MRMLLFASKRDRTRNEIVTCKRQRPPSFLRLHKSAPKVSAPERNSNLKRHTSPLGEWRRVKFSTHLWLLQLEAKSVAKLSFHKWLEHKYEKATTQSPRWENLKWADARTSPTKFGWWLKQTYTSLLIVEEERECHWSSHRKPSRSMWEKNARTYDRVNFPLDQVSSVDFQSFWEGILQSQGCEVHCERAIGSFFPDWQLVL